MIEVLDFEKDIDKRSWFSHLLLGGDVKGFVENNKEFDSSKLEIKLEVNGYPVRVCDFNKVLSEWSDRIANHLKMDLKYNESELAIQRAARDLIKSKLGNIQEKLDMVEDSLWKLEE